MAVTRSDSSSSNPKAIEGSKSDSKDDDPKKVSKNVKNKFVAIKGKLSMLEKSSNAFEKRKQVGDTVEGEGRLKLKAKRPKMWRMLLFLILFNLP